MSEHSANDARQVEQMRQQIEAYLDAACRERFGVGLDQCEVYLASCVPGEFEPCPPEVTMTIEVHDESLHPGL